MEEAKITPMIRQYLQIKEKYRDAILFFRLGDFYEMFFEDAEKASKILDIALTSRNRNDESPIPLCGVPYHAATPYIGRLLDAGYKVAICEQVEDPRLAKGVVQREVVRVITPGTITEGEALDAHDNNFLVAVSRGRGDYGLALTDVTTGEFRFTQIEDYSALIDEIGRIHPREILLAEGEPALLEQLRSDFPSVHLSPIAGICFSRSAQERLRSLKLWSGQEDQEWEQGIQAASAIVSFLEENLPEVLKALRDLQPYSASQYLMLDETTRRNLELLRDFQGNTKGSLLGVLDYTLTPMGARRLRQWLLYPLLNEKLIRQRHEGIEELVENYKGRQELRTGLKGVQDLERLGGRTVAGSAHARDLGAVKDSLRALSPIKERLRDWRAEIFSSLRDELWDLPEVVELVARAIVDGPPPTLGEGGFIRPGFHGELDEIRAIRSNAKDWIARFESSERKRTGIQSLKVRYNRVFGYYIEVTKANLKSVPTDYIRKQTLVNGERYITPDLKEYEAKVLSSEEEIVKLELSLFAQVREKVASYYEKMKQTSHALATLDVLLSLAEAAESHHFIRPKMDGGLVISIREGRHPVVEAALGRGAFVPNDCHLDPESQQIMILTGPNMAGKSTYMRQVALIVIMAQMGGFVPAAEARIGLVDRIFTRIGAADSLARGESTFMVEMKETAHILRHASARSLILLDEVGRGTSTFDGISIAWSVAEHLHDMQHRPRTLFATHYHELTDLALAKERVKNFNFAVKEWKGEVIFLRSLVEGASSRSYGIHVARLAGLPPLIVQRAKEILKNLEGGELDDRGQPRLARGSWGDEQAQMGLFGGTDHRLREELKKVDVSVLTPIEALNLLHRLAEQAKKEGR
ncbi:MAG: DNA mismatch repair protein MutS [Candidatus Binatia bacterium]